MSKHLRKRGAVWHYYRDVPPDVRGVLGKQFWRFSLRTTSQRQAEDARDRWGAKFQAEIAAARGMTPTDKLALFEPVILGPNATHEERANFVGAFSNPLQMAEYRQLIIPVVEQAIHRASSLEASERALVDEAGGPERLHEEVQIERGKLTMREMLGLKPKDGAESRALAARAAELDRKQSILTEIGMPAPAPPKIQESPSNPRVRTALENYLAQPSPKTGRRRSESMVRHHRLYISRLAEFAGNPTLQELSPARVSEFVEAHGELPNWRVSTPEEVCSGLPERKCSRDRSKKAPRYRGAFLL
ncbi:MAG: DUF6538 domain-containing protein, partial [Hyphomicrobiaceae bacterium]